MRDIYHCTPLELDAQPAERVIMDLSLHNTQKKYDALEAEQHRNMGKRKSSFGGGGLLGRRK